MKTEKGVGNLKYIVTCSSYIFFHKAICYSLSHHGRLDPYFSGPMIGKWMRPLTYFMLYLMSSSLKKTLPQWKKKFWLFFAFFLLFFFFEKKINFLYWKYKGETTLLIHHHCVLASKVWILAHFFTGLLFTNNSHGLWKNAPKFKLWKLERSDDE